MLGRRGFYRPKPLGIRVAAVRGGSSTGLSGYGVLTAVPTTYSVDYSAWDSACWQLLHPGIYRVEIVGPGGGGGGGSIFYIRKGWAGDQGVLLDTLVTLRTTPAGIQVGVQGQGGAALTSGTAGRTFSAVTGVGSAAVGTGGQGASPSTGATEMQRTAVGGYVLSDGTSAGSGGFGGDSAGSDSGTQGGGGKVILTLVG